MTVDDLSVVFYLFTKVMILLTGGAGYIGSHTLLELLQSGEEVLVVDNFVNSKRESVRRVEELTGKCAVGVEEVDLCDEAALDGVFERHRIDAVIHFAGLKAVGESTQQPLRYYHNNITGTLNLLRCMEKHRVYRLAFSSSGNPILCSLSFKFIRCLCCASRFVLVVT